MLNHGYMSSFFGELAKTAKVVTKLLPHQQRVVDRIQQEDQPGLVVIHGLGSGKTLTSIAAQDALGMKSQVIAPASLLGNYKKEQSKHQKGRKPGTDLMSMQNMAVKGIPPSAPLMIVDEAHRARDPSSATFQMLKGNTAQKRLLLSGSPFYNHPSDIAGLIDIAADRKILPYDRDEFSRRYITEKIIHPSLKQKVLNHFRDEENRVKPGTVPVLYDKMAPELRDAFHKWIDYHPGSTENFPTVTRQNVEVPMSAEQLKVYDTLMDKAPAWVAAKVKRGLPPSKQEAQQLNSFLTASRQASNSTSPFQVGGTVHEPKVQKAFENLQKTLTDDPTARAVVYSNFLQAGIDPYKRKLDEAKIPYGEFTGQMPMKKREQLVRDYNEGKLRTLLLSSAGGEGLDLKGTRLMQILEPHWNEEKLKQVEGRGARYMSHAHLPKDKQNLLIENYLATRPEHAVSKTYNAITGRKRDQSVDEYLTQMSADKANLINQFKSLLPNQPKTAAVKKWKPTEESAAISRSFGAHMANEAKFVMPVAAALGSFGSQVGVSAGMGNEGGVLGGAIGLGLGHLLARHVGVPMIMDDAKRLARAAIKSPSKENALADNAKNLQWGNIAHHTLDSSLLPLGNHVAMKLQGYDFNPALLAGSIGASAVGALTSGILDKYKNRIALLELENARMNDTDRDAERLRRMRRQVSELEGKVEGDGWKRDESIVRQDTKPKTPKDRSGKGW